MSATLDVFFGSPAPPQPLTSTAEPSCFKCGKAISDKDPKYWLKVKKRDSIPRVALTEGKMELHCRDCAKKILKPQENTVESI